MKRLLLQIVSKPYDLLQLSQNELAHALLEDMQAREANPLYGMAMRDGLGNALVTPATFSALVNPKDLQTRLNKSGAQAYALLERSGFIEPDHGMNGRNGYLILTANGRTSTEAVDYEHVRLRSMLQEEMLHPALRGNIYRDFAADELDAAVNEAFRTLEIEVRTAAGLPDKEYNKPIIGKVLMYRAFGNGAPLSLPTDTKSESDALVDLFSGAMGQFRNPTTHTRRTFDDVREAIEELMLASRLLRLVDTRRPPKVTG